ncbi:MAG: hypothetical protein HC896_10525 [Bacteroidales bacterium]|nr:hypothetical protein [Bacteroidales bacterium]
MKKLIILSLSTLALVVTSCSINAPLGATSNKIEKSGVATRTIWFNLAFGNTDVSLQAAAKNGGITKIATADYYYRAGLFKKTYTTTVTGE